MTCTQTVVSFHNMKGESYSSYALQKAEVWTQGWNLHGQDIVYQKFCSIYFLARATKPGGGAKAPYPPPPPPYFWPSHADASQPLTPALPPRSNFCSAATAFLPHYGILIHIVCLTFTMHAWLLTLHNISHSNQALSICHFGARAYVRTHVKHRQHVITIANCTKDSCTKIRCLWRPYTHLLDTASYLTAFCEWDSGPHLAVTPA